MKKLDEMEPSLDEVRSGQAYTWTEMQILQFNRDDVFPVTRPPLAEEELGYFKPAPHYHLSPTTSNPPPPPPLPSTTSPQQSSKSPARPGSPLFPTSNKTGPHSPVGGNGESLLGMGFCSSPFPAFGDSISTHPHIDHRASSPTLNAVEASQPPPNVFASLPHVQPSGPFVPPNCSQYTNYTDDSKAFLNTNKCKQGVTQSKSNDDNTESDLLSGMSGLELVEEEDEEDEENCSFHPSGPYPTSDLSSILPVNEFSNGRKHPRRRFIDRGISSRDIRQNLSIRRKVAAQVLADLDQYFRQDSDMYRVADCIIKQGLGTGYICEVFGGTTRQFWSKLADMMEGNKQATQPSQQQ